jgi:hypothetical protein
MESPQLASNLMKYLFLGVFYLFILGVFFSLWRQMKQAGVSKTEGKRELTHQPARRGGVPALLVESGSLVGKRFALDSEVSIGRSAENSVVLSNPFVSSRHATVKCLDSEVWLTDEGSKNGTFLNGFRITGRSALKPGDTFVIGDTTFRLVWA